MPDYSFYQVDVFTDQPFGGNPLAVFPDADGLDTDTMQRIAREMNLSETTFVFPSTAADFKIRIFTPTREMPFAGHPVVGTHWLLAQIGRVKLQAPRTTVRFELGVGVRSAALEVVNGKVERVVMDHQRPAFYETATADQSARLAKALTLAPEAISATGWPVRVVSSGIRQLFVPVRSLQEVQAINAAGLDAGALAEVFAELDPVERSNGLLMVLTRETVDPTAHIHTRAFAPSIGIAEDPATGSATGGLGAYLVEHGVIPVTPPTTHIVSEQGVEMGRASRLTIEVDGTPGNLSMVRVSGQAVLLIEGTLHW